MCESSVYVQNRQAKSVESLELRQLPEHRNMKGLYPQDKTAAEQCLVCVRYDTSAWIDKFEIDPVYVGHMMGWMDAYLGKTNLPVNIANNSRYVVFPDGHSTYLTCLKVGTKVFIGVPLPVVLTGDDGMAVVEKAIDEVNKTPAPAKEKTTILGAILSVVK